AAELLALGDPGGMEGRAADRGQRLRRDAARPRPRFAGEDFDPQPVVEAPAVGPDLPHRCGGVSLDQGVGEYLRTGRACRAAQLYRRASSTPSLPARTPARAP